MKHLQELLKLTEAPLLRDFQRELKLFCKDHGLNLDASQSKYTVWKKFDDGRKWMGKWDDAKEAVQWLEMMDRQQTVKGAEVPWAKPNDRG